MHFAGLTKLSFPLTSFFGLGGGTLHPWLFTSCYFSTGMFLYRICRMNQFAWYYGVIVGQAGNPGPKDAGVRLAVVNPTAAYGKINKLLMLEADLVTVSETSATSVVQKEIGRASCRERV